jgi:hypothetical protein
MQYFVFAVGGSAILLIGRSIYIRFERWESRRRLNGAKACLDAVQDTLETLAKSKSEAKHGR